MNQALQEEFRAKTISAQQAAALVKSGQQVYLGCCTSYARAIADALAARSEELEDVIIGCSNIIPPMTVLDRARRTCSAERWSGLRPSPGLSHLHVFYGV